MTQAFQLAILYKKKRTKEVKIMIKNFTHFDFQHKINTFTATVLDEHCYTEGNYNCSDIHRMAVVVVHFQLVIVAVAVAEEEQEEDTVAKLVDIDWMTLVD